MSATTIDSGGSGVGDPTGDTEGTTKPGSDGGRTQYGSVLRTDIQGLRAVAVSLVVIYHLVAVGR